MHINLFHAVKKHICIFSSQAIVNVSQISMYNLFELTVYRDYWTVCSDMPSIVVYSNERWQFGV
jgi:hypothetical protein